MHPCGRKAGIIMLQVTGSMLQVNYSQNTMQLATCNTLHLNYKDSINFVNYFRWDRNCDSKCILFEFHLGTG